MLSRAGFPEGKSIPQILFIQDCQKRGESWRQESQVLLSSGERGNQGWVAADGAITMVGQVIKVVRTHMAD